MGTHFIEIDALDVKAKFPKFYGNQGRFFEIVHKNNPIGFVGIRSLASEDCEMEAFVFKRYRNALVKGTVLSALSLPQTLGFKRCWMTTCRPTVVKLLTSMSKYGVIPTSIVNQNHIFMRKFP